MLQSADHWALHLEQILPPARADVVYRILDGEAVLYDPRNASTHRLNATALAVWHACDGHTAASQVAERLTREYDVPLDTARADVEELLAAFAQAGLVTGPED